MAQISANEYKELCAQVNDMMKKRNLSVGSIYVKGYTRNDGTKVSGYYRKV